MAQHVSFTRVGAAAIAIVACAWLLHSVNAHGDEIQLGVTNLFRPVPPSTTTPPFSVPTPVPGPVETPLTFGPDASEGLDLIDMYQCMCISTNEEEFRRWVGWWLIAAAFGGVPAAVWLRSRTLS